MRVLRSSQEFVPIFIVSLNREFDIHNGSLFGPRFVFFIRYLHCTMTDMFKLVR